MDDFLRFVVVVGQDQPFRRCEVLLSTNEVKEAVRAVETFVLFAPLADVRVYLYTVGTLALSILTVRDGRWRVPTPVSMKEPEPQELGAGVAA